jgi:hypothetical protein
MISGIRLHLAAALLTITMAIANAADPGTDALLGRLARPAPATMPFVEVRYSALLTEPLVVAGELEHRKDGALIRRVQEPYRETTELLGENVSVERDGSRPRRFSLDRAPELRGMLNGFGAILKGDRATLEQHFEVTSRESDNGWRIDLVPRGDKLRARLARVRVDGHADRAKCMVLEEPDGDATIMAIGVSDRGTLPTPLGREQLQSWCVQARAR